MVVVVVVDDVALVVDVDEVMAVVVVVVVALRSHFDARRRREHRDYRSIERESQQQQQRHWVRGGYGRRRSTDRVARVLRRPSFLSRKTTRSCSASEVVASTTRRTTIRPEETLTSVVSHCGAKSRRDLSTGGSETRTISVAS